MTKAVISEAIIVEGRDDVAAVLRAVDAAVIPTHGYGITEETLTLIASAYERQGIIVFTDPDHAGEQIRRRLLQRFPDAKQAWLTRDEAERDGDIGIENASPESILHALLACEATRSDGHVELGAEILDKYSLSGHSNSSEKRTRLGMILGIGQCNASAFVKRLNRFGITEEQLAEAVRQLQEEQA